MGFAAAQHDAGTCLLRARRSSIFLQMTRQAAGIARGRWSGWAQDLQQALMHAAKGHFGHGLGTQRTQLWRIGAELARILLRAPRRHAQHVGCLRQTQGIGQHGLAIRHGWHELFLIIHQYQLAFRQIEQHG